MSEQQQGETQQESQQQEQYVAPGQYYPAFTTADGYSVPGGLFHPPTAGVPSVQIGGLPGQSFVGPPLLGADGQQLLQMQAPAFQAAPLQIGIPGGFHFSPDYSDPPESAMATAPEPEPTFVSAITRGANLNSTKTLGTGSNVVKKQPKKCLWCAL